MLFEDRLDRAGLSLSPNKSEFMSTIPAISLRLRSGPVPPPVSEMKVPGTYVQINGAQDVEFAFRISRVWKTFWSRKELLLHRAGNRRLRLVLLERIMQPTLLYAAGCWSLTLTQKRALKTLQLQLYRRVLGRSEVQVRPGNTTSDERQRLPGLRWRELV